MAYRLRSPPLVYRLTFRWFRSPRPRSVRWASALRIKLHSGLLDGATAGLRLRASAASALRPDSLGARGQFQIQLANRRRGDGWQRRECQAKANSHDYPMQPVPADRVLPSRGGEDATP